MTPISVPRWILTLLIFALTLLSVVVGAAAWGSWGSYLAHPARAGAVVLALVFALVFSCSGLNLSSGKREEVGNRWIFLPMIVLTPLLVWLPPYMDRRDLWVIDGGAARYLGLALLAVGGLLRVWPMFVLGQRFSILPAIQEHHELVTDGPYRHIRHPSYLGGLLGTAGWALVFRSSVGLLIMVPLLGLTIARINAEEALLASEFGSAYSHYRKRSWRLVPWVY
jgi:protein-S-isoprenylcysteine O-methyltransferase Ste14